SSWSKDTSGLASRRQWARWTIRVRTELTFQEATRTAWGSDQREKELPQPQEELAFGLRTWKEEPTRSSTKSTSAPTSKSREVSSTTSLIPSRSKMRSSSFRASSKEKPYWKPEQPPPETARRSMSAGLPSAAMS